MLLRINMLATAMRPHAYYYIGNILIYVYKQIYIYIYIQYSQTGYILHVKPLDVTYIQSVFQSENNIDPLFRLTNKYREIISVEWITADLTSRSVPFNVYIYFMPLVKWKKSRHYFSRYFSIFFYFLWRIYPYRKSNTENIYSITYSIK